MTINGSLCVVSGATEGIGRAIAGALGERGARLALCARTAERVHTTVDDLKSHGVDAWGAACDVSDETSVTDFAAPVAKTCGQVQVLINNAGVGHLGPFTELTTQQIDETLAVNVRG